MTKKPKDVLRKLKTRLEHLGIQDTQLWDNIAEIEEALLFYNELVQRCPVAIFLTKRQKFELLWANKKGEELLEMKTPEEEQAFASLEDNIHPQDLDVSRMRMKRFDVYPRQVQEGAYRIKSSSQKKYQWQYGLVSTFPTEEGGADQLLHVAFNLNEALQDRLNFMEYSKELAKSHEESSVEALTIREKEILRLIVRGFTMREVAEKLKISHHTAGTHRKNLFKKTKVKKTSELVHYALKNGLD